MFFFNPQSLLEDKGQVSKVQRMVNLENQTQVRVMLVLVVMLVVIF